MKMVNKQRIKAALLTILLGLSVLVGNFAFKTETTKATAFTSRLIAQNCDPKKQSCADETGKQIKPKSTKKSAPKKTTDQKIKDLEDKKADTAAVYDKAIAELNKQKEAANTPEEKAAIQEKIEQATAQKSKDVAKAEANIKTAKEKPYKTAKTKAEKADKTIKTQEQKVQSTKDEIKALEAEKQKALIEKGVNSKEYKDLEKKIATKEKTLASEEKKLSEAKAASATAKTEMEKYDPAKTPAKTPEDEKAKEAEIKGFQLPNPTALDEFKVSQYLNAGDKHQSYIKDKGRSGVFDFILATIDVLIKIIGSVALIVLIVGGLILISSGGNEQQLDKGKEIIKFALIGLVIALSAFLIITFVNNFLSVGLPVQTQQ